MWSQPRISFLVHAAVATGLLLGYFAVAASGVREHHPDCYRAGLTTLLPVAILNYLAATFHLVRWLR
jgi:hypothetical protein